LFDKSLNGIHSALCEVYGGSAVDRSNSSRRASSLREGQTGVEGDPKKKPLWPGCKPLFALYPNVSISFPVAVMLLVTLAYPVKHFLEVPHCRSVSFTPACHLVFIKDSF